MCRPIISPFFNQIPQGCLAQLSNKWLIHKQHLCHSVLYKSHLPFPTPGPTAWLTFSACTSSRLFEDVMITSSGENSLTSRVNWNMSPRTWIFPVGHEFPVMVILLARKNYDDIGIHCRVNRCSTDLQIGGLRCPAEVLILNLQRKYLDLSPYGLRRWTVSGRLYLQSKRGHSNLEMSPWSLMKVSLCMSLLKATEILWGPWGVDADVSWSPGGFSWNGGWHGSEIFSVSELSLDCRQQVQQFLAAPPNGSFMALGVCVWGKGVEK